jgi:hypothetical protein
MNRNQLSTRPRNALTAGAAAYLTLLAMSMWIGGPTYFLSLISDGTLLFLAISSGAAFIEACFPPVHTKRTIIIGICTGLTGGFAILLYAFSNI